MMYYGKATNVRIVIIAERGWLKRYRGQECDATVYDDGHCQLNTEQLKPPLPKWQSCTINEVNVIDA